MLYLQKSSHNIIDKHKYKCAKHAIEIIFKIKEISIRHVVKHRHSDNQPTTTHNTMKNNIFSNIEIKTVNAEHPFNIKDIYGVFLCQEGTAQITIGNKEFSIAANSLCIFMPFADMIVQNYSRDFKGIIIMEGVDSLNGAMPHLPFENRLQMRQNPCTTINNEQKKRLQQMLNQYQEKILFYEEKINNDTETFILSLVKTLTDLLVYEIVNIYYEAEPITAEPQKRDHLVFDRFLSALLQHYATERSVAFYAKQQNLTPGYFTSVIKALSGKNAIQWIEEVTIMRAQQYLLSSTLSIREISEKLNFLDQSAFGRYFKNYTGISPLRYRAEKGKK